MEFPSFAVSTVDCNCPDIKYKVTIFFDADNRQEALIDTHNLLPFVGRTLELLNAHRIELNKQYIKETNVEQK